MNPLNAYEIPIRYSRVERYELVADSGGAGRFRGGLGVVRDIRVLAAGATVALRSARQRFPAQGIAGGAPGGLGAFIRNPARPDEARLPSTSSTTPLAHGDVLRIVTPGGGGYGDPLSRDRTLVAKDVAEGKVSAEAARRLYGYEGGAGASAPAAPR